MNNNDKMVRMAKDLAFVRRTGATNMFDRQAVIKILKMVGYNDTADYIRKNITEYVELLEMSGEY